MDASTIAAALSGGVPAITAAYFAYRSSIRAAAVSAEANHIAASKVDAEAYERSQRFYESLVTEAEKHIDRLRGQTDKLNEQVDRLYAQIATEQDVSNVLRNQIRALTTQISTMEITLNELRLGISTKAS